MFDDYFCESGCFTQTVVSRETFKIGDLVRLILEILRYENYHNKPKWNMNRVLDYRL